MYIENTIFLKKNTSISEFRKAMGYKVNKQSSIKGLYLISEQLKNKIVTYIGMSKYQILRYKLSTISTLQTINHCWEKPKMI